MSDTTIAYNPADFNPDLPPEPPLFDDYNAVYEDFPTKNDTKSIDYRTIALQYHAMGFNVTATRAAAKEGESNKGTMNKWSHWQTERQTVGDVNALSFNRPNNAGVGFIAGINGLRLFDFDKCPTFAPVGVVLGALGLPASYEWVSRTGSGNGWHIIFKCDEPLSTKALQPKKGEAGVFSGNSIKGDFDHLELRWERCHNVLPPSLHKSGGRYIWHGTTPTNPPALVSAEAVLKAFLAIATPRSVAEMTPIQVTTATTEREDFDPYARLADKVCERFDMVAYAKCKLNAESQDEGREVRILGNGGLLINPATGQWNCFIDGVGGKALQLINYLEFNDPNPPTQRRFFEVLEIGAAAIGEAMPEPLKKAVGDNQSRPAGGSGAPQLRVINTQTGEIMDAPKTRKQKPKPKSVEYIAALTELSYSFRMNECLDAVEVNGQPLSDGLAATIRTQMRDKGFDYVNVMEDVYTSHAYQNRYHPVRDFLNALEWDGKDHISTLASYFTDKHEVIQYPNRTTRSVFHAWLWRWMVGAVGKVMGSQQNPMLVLDGAQNIGKSFFAGWIGSPLPEYFIEGAINPEDKDSYIRLCSKWIWEVGELGATTRKADREALKDFITRRDVTVRLPFGRRDMTKPAMASLIGTINNESGFLKDPTGNRRFLVMTLQDIDWEYYEKVDPRHLWAQAVAAYKEGERGRLEPVEARLQSQLNGCYEVEDPMEDLIRFHFDLTHDRRDFMASADIVSTLENRGVRGNTKQISMDVANAAPRLGLEKARQAGGGARGYFGIKAKLTTVPTSKGVVGTEIKEDDGIVF